MFHYRKSSFDPRIAELEKQIRTLQNEVGRIGRKTGQRMASNASDARDQISEALAPIIGEIIDRFRSGRRYAVDEASNWGNEAVKTGARLGNSAARRIAAETGQRPLIAIAVAVGIGLLIGFMGRRRQASS